MMAVLVSFFLFSFFAFCFFALTIKQDIIWFFVFVFFCLKCKAIILSYGALEKLQKVPTSPSSSNSSSGSGGGGIGVDHQHCALSLRSLLQSLPKGSASDIANSLLVSLEHSAGLWRKRFDSVSFDKRSRGGGSSSSSSSSSSSNNRGISGTHYLAQQKATIPCRAIFDILAASVPQVSLDKALEKIFVIK